MIGTVTYLLPKKYSVPRTNGWLVGIAAGPYPTDNPSPGVYRLFAPGALPYVLYTFKLFDAFVPFTNTRWTTDFVLEEAYYSFPPFTVNNPADVTIGLTYSPTHHHPVIWLQAFGYTGDPAIYQLPAPPGSYWNQPGFNP